MGREQRCHPGSGARRVAEAPAPAGRRRKAFAGGIPGALAAAGLLLGSWGDAADAQAVTDLDSGRFEIRIGGRVAGSESFVVRREGGVVRAVGRIAAEGVGAGVAEMDVRLQTDASFRPTTYALRARTGPITAVDGVWQGDRLRLHIASEQGERWKEFLIRGPVAVLERGVAHHYYLLFRQVGERPGARIPVIVPSENRQAVATVAARGAEGVTIGAERIEARRYEVTVDGERSLVWLDPAGRLLRISFPGADRVAVRAPEEGG